ncbi:MAG: HDOD domain-containing protein [Deltaproteobacteria bacterium]|nr:HDOD domain-containing protein [Deltaproteobacteria bacterium]MBW2017523.1 HDOD domain-containing protein [Deltaproteobacteria bacterium]MBW2130295.1 HDOD domain-containing protein [Deltaproteobacteria bacterium]MBW2302623.1 HDOD domain-containing protein [Deltaproteobacteria bacterium]
MGHPNILDQLDRIQDLPALPAVAREVNALLCDPDTSIDKLSRTIEKDQAIASSILKLVNSAFFGLSRRVGNIPHAVVLLGFNTVRNAVLALSVVDLFKPVPFPGFDATLLWRHSIATAVTGRYLAQASGLYPPDDAFVGGLLHDMGKFLLSQFFQEDFQKAWELSEELGIPLHEAEREKIGINHAQVGKRLARKWKLPPGLTDAIGSHHAYKKSAQEPLLLILVHAADHLVNSLTQNRSRAIRQGLFPEAEKALGTILDDHENWFPEICEEIDSACRFFLKERKE